jgi:signal transduction histidine kinase
MPPARDEIVATLVSGALAAPDVARAYADLLQTLRTAWQAERTLLLRRDGDAMAVALVAADPGQSSLEGLDSAALEALCEAETPIVLGAHDSVLGLGLRPRATGRWGIALVRPRTPWTTVERRGLGELRPHLELILTIAITREQLDQAVKREVAAAAEHERFLNVISHELRNPLAPILMWTSTLRRLRGDDPEVLRATQAIAHAVNIERRLIEELLDLSRLERGVVELNWERTDLRDVVRATLDQYRPAVAEAHLSLDEELAGQPLAVHADPRRLAQALEAPLDNAVKFTPAGGRIRLAIGERAGRAEMTLTDTGPGIPADVLPRLFTPFVHGANARGGLGLGLAIARRLLALHEGTIDAENPVGGGARFVITLPLARAAT